MIYQYPKDSNGNIINNRLRYVQEEIAATNYNEDIDNQTTLTREEVLAEKLPEQPGDNYTYDSIGNLINDTKEGITNITWNVYGKIESITKATGIISYTYDASGNRISKTFNSKSTWYVRDASGNVMSTYITDAAINSGHLTQSEIHLYGSSRLGILNTNTDVQVPVNTNGITTFIRGNKFFELNNHLGNVLATISDKKLQHSTDGTTVDYYNADVITANDYYPGGMQMPGRKYSAENSSKYRYGFNGKENDNEVKGEGNQQDYGMRIYDPRLGRFLSTDPLTKSYPMLTPYQFASNSPIAGVDLDGLEFLPINSSMYRMMTTEHTVLSFTTNNKIELKTYEASQVATQYKNIPDVLKDANLENFKFVSGGIIGTNGQDRNSETDGPIVFDPSRYHVKAQFLGAAFDGTSSQDIAPLRGNAIPGRSVGNNGGALGKNGIGIFRNAYLYSYNVALGDESKNRNRFYDATNIVDDYLNKNSIKDATLTGVSGRNSMVNFLTDGSLPTDGLNAKDCSFEQLENSLRVAYSGYQILLQKGIGTQPGLADKVTPLNEEYIKRGGKLNFAKANDFNNKSADEE